jgi:hypothetical protein
MESPKCLIPVVMMSITAIASSLPAQALQSRPLNIAGDDCDQRVVPVILATAVPATSTEPEQLIQFRVVRAIESGFPVRYGIRKWPLCG